MTTLEYIEKQIRNHTLNLERETKRGVPQEMLDNIKKKIGYYEEARDALKKVGAK